MQIDVSRTRHVHIIYRVYAACMNHELKSAVLTIVSDTHNYKTPIYIH